MALSTKMKRIDIFCASQASTAICHSMDQASCSSSNVIQLGGRAIDRYNPIINDSSRKSTSKSLIAPCSSYSQLPIDPKPRKSTSSKPNSQNKKNAIKGLDQKRKTTTAEKSTQHVINNSSKPIDGSLKKGWLKAPSDSITPPGSTRSLLSDTASILNGSSHFDQVLPFNNKVDIKMAQDETTNPASKPCPKSGSNEEQVVVLRVSLHCKGCEGKVRKHLSRMQGVTSFNIDFAAKKVTVVGDVTPLSVLASLSKVKNAQLWPTSASAVGSGILETKNTNLSN